MNAPGSTKNLTLVTSSSGSSASIGFAMTQRSPRSCRGNRAAPTSGFELCGTFGRRIGPGDRNGMIGESECGGDLAEHDRISITSELLRAHSWLRLRLPGSRSANANPPRCKAARRIDFSDATGWFQEEVVPAAALLVPPALTVPPAPLPPAPVLGAPAVPLLGFVLVLQLH